MTISRHFIIFAINALFLSFHMALAGPTVDLGAYYGQVELLEAIDVSVTGSNYQQSHQAKVDLKELKLGDKTKFVRHMNMEKDGQAAYFAYKMGIDLGLKAGDLIIVEIEYPDSIEYPMATYVINRACGLHSGFSTGVSVGAALKSYLTSNAESIAYPQTETFQTWRQACYVHENIADTDIGKGADALENDIKDGFWLMIAQSSYQNNPLSKGSTVSSIKLYKVPDPNKLMNLVNYPEGFGRKHIGARNEMGTKPYMKSRGDADSLIQDIGPDGKKLPAQAAYSDPLQWLRDRANMQKIISGNTIMPSVFEFGNNQMISDIGGAYPFGIAANGDLYDRLLEMMANEFSDISLQNYYEYEGETYAINEKGESFGLDKKSKVRAEPLNRKPFDDSSQNNQQCTGYGDFVFTETLSANIVTDQAENDLKKIVDKTIVQPSVSGSEAVKAYMKTRFLGPWFRPKSVAMPISFDHDTRKRFAQDLKFPVPSKGQLNNDKDLYETYIQWWFQKRQNKYENVQKYIDERVDDHNMRTTLTFYSKEAGPRVVGVGSVITDEVDSDRFKDYNFNEVISIDQAVNANFKAALFARQVGFKKQQCNAESEPFHADPGPWGQGGGRNVYETYPISRRLYSSANAQQSENFVNKYDKKLAVSFYSLLNEDILRAKNEAGETEDLTGYFVSDMERNGPFASLGMARALAFHDPSFIQILSSYNYTTGYPHIISRFNRAYLSLPDIPSYIDDELSKHEDIVVRVYPAYEEEQIYVAVINTGLNTFEKTDIQLPQLGQVTDLLLQADSAELGAIQSLSLNIEPGEVRTFKIYNEEFVNLIPSVNAGCTNQSSSVTSGFILLLLSLLCLRQRYLTLKK